MALQGKSGQSIIITLFKYKAGYYKYILLKLWNKSDKHKPKFDKSNKKDFDYYMENAKIYKD